MDDWVYFCDLIINNGRFIEFHVYNILMRVYIFLCWNGLKTSKRIQWYPKLMQTWGLRITLFTWPTMSFYKSILLTISQYYTNYNSTFTKKLVFQKHSIFSSKISVLTSFSLNLKRLKRKCTEFYRHINCVPFTYQNTWKYTFKPFFDTNSTSQMLYFPPNKISYKHSYRYNNEMGNILFKN